MRLGRHNKQFPVKKGAEKVRAAEVSGLRRALRMWHLHSKGKT